MKHLQKIGLALILTSLVTSCLNKASNVHYIENARIQDTVRIRIKNILGNENDWNKEKFRSDILLTNYYANNNYSPIWVSGNKPLPKADTLLLIIKNAYKDGLDPENYHSTLIESLIKDSLKQNNITRHANALARIDILLSDAFFTYATHQYAGSTRFNNRQKEHLKEVSLTDSLNKAITNGNVNNILSHFACTHYGYINLRKQLGKLLSRHNPSDSLADTIREIAINMERWRWLPHIMQQPYIIVNIPAFNLSLQDSNKTVLDMKIVVGKTNKKTPLFVTTIKSITLNPWWEIPNSIAVHEMLPAIKKDKDYLNKNNIKVYNSWNATAKEVSIDSINWALITPSNFTYRFRQIPGVSNALGRIAFMMPNKFSVYLHDTPQKGLFTKSVRAFSHGCIRIEKPIELATYLLQSNKDWTKDNIIKAIDHNARVSIPLATPVNVYICYFTAWTNKEGQLVLSPDIYKNDTILNEALNASVTFR